jgi:hypothetical protein
VHFPDSQHPGEEHTAVLGHNRTDRVYWISGQITISDQVLLIRCRLERSLAEFDNLPHIITSALRLLLRFRIMRRLDQVRYVFVLCQRV